MDLKCLIETDPKHTDRYETTMPGVLIENVCSFCNNCQPHKGPSN